MLKSLVNSAKSVNGNLYNLLSNIQNNFRHKLRVDYPLKITNISPVKKLGIVSEEKILSGANILSVSLTQGITGYDLQDCDQNTTNRLQEIADKIATKYHEKNPTQYYYTQNMLKCIFQILAQQSDPSLSVHHYAKFLYDDYPKNVPLNWPLSLGQFITSTHLQSLIDAQRTYLMSLAGDLEQNGLPLINYPELLKTVGIVRSRALNFTPEDPKIFTKDSVLILCPVIDVLNHSFKPNCRIEGRYNSLENDSFVELRVIEDIQPGEELTINYGNYNNYDMLMKFGFMVDNNPFDEFPLNLNFGNYLEYTTQLFDLKNKKA